MVVQDQNEEVEISSTFQQLDDDNPEHRVRQDKGEEDDLAKNKALEEDAEQADNSHNEERSSLEGTILVTSQEDMRSNRNKREQVSLSIQADLAIDSQLSRGKRARKSRIDHRRKVRKFKQVGMKNGRKTDLAKENVIFGKEIKDLKRQNKQMKKKIQKLSKRKRPNKSKESKGKRIKSGNARK